MELEKTAEADEKALYSLWDGIHVIMEIETPPVQLCSSGYYMATQHLGLAVVEG